jgi:hypothetical protein
MHDIGINFDPLFASPDIYGVQGLTFAVTDDYVMPQASVSSRGASVVIGNTKINKKSLNLSNLLPPSDRKKLIEN